MKVNYIEALKEAAKRRPKPDPNAIEKIAKQVEQMKLSVKSRAVAA